jgi:nitrogen fixation protein NifT
LRRLFSGKFCAYFKFNTQNSKYQTNEVKPVPNVMIRVKDNGALLFYIAKKDQEDEIASVEKDTEAEWGGKVELTDGSTYYIDPITPRPSFPATLRFKRAD